jgi:hypothetical protein
MIRNTEVYADLLLVGIELLRKRDTVRSRVGVRNIEDETIREDAAGTRDRKGATGERFLINLQLREAGRLIGK